MTKMNFDSLTPNHSVKAYFHKTKALTYIQQVKRNLRQTRRKAIKRSIPFSINIEDVPLNKTCPVLGISLSFTGDADSTPTIDKIKPSLGYVPGNVRLISHKANRWKNDMSEEDAKLLISNWNKISA